MITWSKTNKEINTKPLVQTAEGLSIKCKVFPKATNVKLQRAADTEPLGLPFWWAGEGGGRPLGCGTEWQSDDCWTYYPQ